MENENLIQKMTPEIEAKVTSYVFSKYKSYEGKTLVIKDMGTHFEILKHKDGGPLFLSKEILN
jgi:hypothetical protein